MIVGKGDIASVLTDREDRLFFVSGVSNSKETDEAKYQREKDLLLSQDRSKHIVYVSSLCIYYNNSRYTQHKRQMEQLIKDNFPLYTIFRIGLITWGDNPNTLINFFRNRIKQGQKLEVQAVYRYIVDKEEFLHWINMAPAFSSTMNITGKRMTVKEIIKEYCVSALYE